MEISTILTADILDIIFEGRNKEYGAYELRRSYRKRLLLSLSVMLLLILLLFTGFLLAGKTDDQVGKEFVIPDQQLAVIDQPEKEIIEPPPMKKVDPPRAEMRQYTNIKLVNEDVRPDERPPEMTELEDVKIGAMNVEGVKDDGIVAPPAEDDGKGVVVAPKKEEEDWDRTFNKVEIESQYPGGPAAWQRYLYKSLKYPQEAMDNEVQGTVMVMFIVDKEGNVSEVQAVDGPEELRAEAVRVIRKSGKWTPAVQNGRQVKSYKRQPISFKITVE